MQAVLPTRPFDSKHMRVTSINGSWLTEILLRALGRLVWVNHIENPYKSLSKPHHPLRNNYSFEKQFWSCNWALEYEHLAVGYQVIIGTELSIMN